jgi:hypothetical protein
MSHEDAMEGVDVGLQFLSSTLDGGELHGSAALPLGKEPHGTNRKGGWVGPRAGLEAVV